MGLKAARQSGQAGATAEGKWLRLLRRAASSKPGASWGKDELLDFIYWTRQFLALVAGLTWGVLGLTGLYAFYGALATNLLSVYYWVQFQRLDVDDYGGNSTFLMEGLPPSIGLFLLVWILTYSFLGL